MRKIIFALLALCMCHPVFAQDSGMYFDAERSGEGILLMRDKDANMTLFLFTFGGECNYIEPSVSPSESECDTNGQRWFWGSGKYDPNLDQVKAEFFIVTGVSYPDGDMDPFDPFIQNVGKAREVGEFTLRRTGDGWRLFVDRDNEDWLEEEDVLYSRIWTFTTLLFQAGH